MQLFKKWKHKQTKTDVYYFEINVEVFYSINCLKRLSL